MDIARLNVNDEQIGASLNIYIQTATERVMEGLKDNGFTEEQIKANQEVIEWQVINEASEALGYYFEGETMDKMVAEAIRNLKI
jgi:hypothetical protein